MNLTKSSKPLKAKFSFKMVIALISAFTLVACGGNSQNSSPTDSPAPGISESANPEVEELEDYFFYFVSETAQGFRLIREVQQVSKAENELGDDKGFNSLIMLVDGQLPPFDGDHRTLWNNGTKVNSVTVTDGVATVDLTLGRISLGSESEQRAIDQIVWTLTQNNPEVTAVKFTVDGAVSESLAGHVDFAQTFVPAPSYEVMASVWIDLLDRSDVKNPVSISGSACTFEANLAWELTQSGDVVTAGSTTAKMACPDRSDWSIELGDLAPGNYVLKVSDLSAQDGSVIFEDTKAFTVIQ